MGLFRMMLLHTMPMLAFVSPDHVWIMVSVAAVHVMMIMEKGCFHICVLSVRCSLCGHLTTYILITGLADLIWDMAVIVVVLSPLRSLIHYMVAIVVAQVTLEASEFY